MEKSDGTPSGVRTRVSYLGLTYLIHTAGWADFENRSVNVLDPPFRVQCVQELKLFFTFELESHSRITAGACIKNECQYVFFNFSFRSFISFVSRPRHVHFGYQQTHLFLLSSVHDQKGGRSEVVRALHRQLAQVSVSLVVVFMNDF